MSDVVEREKTISPSLGGGENKSGRGRQSKLVSDGVYSTKSDDDGPLPRVGSNVVSKADVVERRVALRNASVRFPPWKVDAAVVRAMRDIILYGCLNVEPIQKAREGYFSDKFSLQELASEIKVALPWSLRLATDELIQIILSTEGVKSERTSKGTLISIHLGQEVARHFRKGRALERKKNLISEGWYKEDEVTNWRLPVQGQGRQIPERFGSSSSDHGLSDGGRG